MKVKFLHDKTASLSWENVPIVRRAPSALKFYDDTAHISRMPVYGVL